MAHISRHLFSSDNFTSLPPVCNISLFHYSLSHAPFVLYFFCTLRLFVSVFFAYVFTLLSLNLLSCVFLFLLYFF